MSARIAIFGGSFDPVHLGHIASAQVLATQLDLDAIHFMPCGRHAHKNSMHFTDRARVDMLNLVLGGTNMALDLREIRRAGVSYTIDSCREIRSELGDKALIGLVIGDDLLSSLHRWKEWNTILDYVNLIVINRAQDTLDEAGYDERSTAVNALLSCSVSHMDRPAGDVVTLRLPETKVSSSAVRQILFFEKQTAGDKQQALEKRLDSRVIRYLRENQLLS